MSSPDMIYSADVVKSYDTTKDTFNETDLKVFAELERVGTEGKDIADFGCGTGPHARRLMKEMKAASVTGVDIDPKMIKLAKEHSAGIPGLDFMVSNGKETPLGKESVDVVLSNFAIHYFEDSTEIFNEMARVLKPGGHCVCTFNVTDVDPGFEHLYNEAMPIRLGQGDASFVVLNLIKSSEELQSAINGAGFVIERGDVLDHPNAVVDSAFAHKDKIEKFAVVLVLRKAGEGRDEMIS